MLPELLRRYVRPDPGGFVYAADLLRVVVAAGAEEASGAALARVVRSEFRAERVVLPGRSDELDNELGWEGVGWTTLGAEALAWEMRLEGHGLTVDAGRDSRHETLTDPAILAGMAVTSDLAEASEYTSQAERHLHEHRWRTPRDRRTWAMHVAGVKRSEIARASGLRPRQVDRFLDRHRRHCGLLRVSKNGRRYGGPRHETARAYEAAAEWPTDTERLVWRLVEVERWKFRPAAAELGVTPTYVERVIRRHRGKAYAQ